MRYEAHFRVLKIWLYAAASVMLGAWISPLLFNAGKALADVSSQKPTNALLERLAELCRVSEFPVFFNTSLLVAAALLFFPWMEWIYAKSEPAHGLTGPWRGAQNLTFFRRLLKKLRHICQGCVGFLVMSGIILSLGMLLVPLGYFSIQHPPCGLQAHVMRVFTGVMLLAIITESLFRGIAMGNFLRSLRPPAAIAMSSGLFAFVIAVIPSGALNVADPEASGIGFEMLKICLLRFADWKFLIASFIPWLMLGGMLAYVRWRTDSLWVPISLIGAWFFGKTMMAELCISKASPEVGHFLQQSMIPWIAILLTSAMMHTFTSQAHDENPAAS